jgi:Fe-S cluster assembly protein SufD
VAPSPVSVDRGVNVQEFIEGFEAARSVMASTGVSWVDSLRRDAAARFADVGVPTRKREGWKYTDLSALRKRTWRDVRAEDANAHIDVIPSIFPADVPRFRLVFVHGRAKPELWRIDGLPPGVSISTLAGMLDAPSATFESNLGRIATDAHQPLLSLNTALMRDGFVVHIGAGVRLAAPLEIVFIGGMAADAVAYHPRNLVIVEEGGSLTLVEHHVGIGGGAYFANAVTELDVGDDGELRHYVLQSQGDHAVHVETVHGVIGRNATLEAFRLARGGQVSRSEVAVRLEGMGARCTLSGAYLARDKQICDNTTLIEHHAPDTACREVFKGVLDDAARGVFQGCIVVQRDARNADGHQLSKALLLSDAAEIDQKPELRIFADAVKCSHGAAAGQLDDDALFYLRARGLPEAAARRLLIEAFLADAFDEISEETVRAAMRAAVADWFAGGRGTD